MKVLDLFSGIGGFSLGLERAGMHTVAFCECEPYARRVLAKHWPEVPCYDDVRTLTGARLAADGISVDVVCGGFPCQDISEANLRGLGLDGSRSGLWRDYARIIGDIRPVYAIVENVSALLRRGLHRILNDLASIGYDAEWHCIPASAVGAPHGRDRIWIVAYPAKSQRGPVVEQRGMARKHRILANGQENAGGSERVPAPLWIQSWREVANQVFAVDDGLSRGLDGYNAIANAVVPAIPEMIGRAIMQAAA